MEKNKARELEDTVSHQTINNQSVNQSISQSINQSINNQSAYQSINVYLPCCNVNMSQLKCFNES